jgi:hypothetical protein
MDRKNTTLWIFGPSLTLPWELEDPKLGWPSLVADKLGVSNIKNFGTSSVDNFYIYHNFLTHKDAIASDDLVIVGCSHPNRKMFVLDRNNPIHLDVLPSSLHYSQSDIEFIRSRNPINDNQIKWTFMKPKDSGTAFYDQWFRNYFSDREQRCNFQAYYDSIHSRAPCQCVSIFFSKESTEGLDINPTLFYLDFVIENQVNISKNDFHLNAHGHDLFANALLPFIR